MTDDASLDIELRTRWWANGAIKLAGWLVDLVVRHGVKPRVVKRS